MTDTHVIKGRILNNHHFHSSIINGIRVSNATYFRRNRIGVNSSFETKTYKVCRYLDKTYIKSTVEMKTVRLARADSNVGIKNTCTMIIAHNAYLSFFDGYLLSEFDGVTILDMDKIIPK